MFHSLKPLFERFPSLALVYRALRDVRDLRRQRPQQTPHGFRLAGNSVMQAGAYEPDVTARVVHYLVPTDVFVDVGVNIGYYTCLARSHGRHSVVIEPFPQNLPDVYLNLRENGWCDTEVLPVGLGGKPGIATLYVVSTGASLVPGWAGASPLVQRTILLSTLDYVFGDRFSGERLLMKIDVEGAENLVLEGARRTLAMSPRPVWLVEINLAEHHPARLNPAHGKTFQAFWRGGYEVRAANKEQCGVPSADVERWIQCKPCPLGHNSLFVDAS